MKGFALDLFFVSFVGRGLVAFQLSVIALNVFWVYCKSWDDLKHFYALRAVASSCWLETWPAQLKSATTSARMTKNRLTGLWMKSTLSNEGAVKLFRLCTSLSRAWSIETAGFPLQPCDAAFFAVYIWERGFLQVRAVSTTWGRFTWIRGLCHPT